MRRGQFWPFLKCSHFSNRKCFSERFFAHDNFNVVVQSFFAPFCHFYILTQTDHFAKAMAFARAIHLRDAPFLKWPHFSNIWCFFERFFAQNNFNILVEWIFACFSQFYLLTQADHFAKAIAF